MPEGSARLVEGLRAADALAWVEREPGGAIAMMAMSAKGAGVEVTAAPEAEALLGAAVERALAAGALRALAWQAVGRVPGGAPVAVVAASAPSRKEARAALELLHAGLAGVAQRRDVL